MDNKFINIVSKYVKYKILNENQEKNIIDTIKDDLKNLQDHIISVESLINKYESEIQKQKLEIIKKNYESNKNNNDINLNIDNNKLSNKNIDDLWKDIYEDIVVQIGTKCPNIINCAIFLNNGYLSIFTPLEYTRTNIIKAVNALNLQNIVKEIICNIKYTWGHRQFDQETEEEFQEMLPNGKILYIPSDDKKRKQLKLLIYHKKKK